MTSNELFVDKRHCLREAVSKPPQDGLRLRQKWVIMVVEDGVPDPCATLVDNFPGWSILLVNVEHSKTRYLCERERGMSVVGGL